MSAEKLITDHIDIWTSAVQAKSASGRGSSKKRELYGIKKLRELILELAVRGKLVPQDPSDEPASVLLERIAAEKAQLVKDGKIKKSKSFPDLSPEELNFDLPNGWQWCRVGELFLSIASGGTPSKREPAYWDGDIPWASVKDLGKSKLLHDTQDHISDAGLIAGSRLANIDDLLICTRMGLGKIAIVKTPMAFNQDLKSATLSKFIQTDFFLNSYSTIKITGTGTTVAGITQDQLLNYVFALPPMSEQHRIVAKVDELMALCDQLEQQTEASLDAHQVLVETLLATLTNSQDATELMANWARISEHFDTLFTTEQSIDQLKQTILQLAVMGKLVPQDPNDEPAAKLLERIAIEKAQLVKEKKIKKQKALPPIANDEKPFELPKGWEFAYMQDLCSLITDGTHQTPKYTDDGRPFISAQCVKPFKFMPQHCRYVSEEHYQSYIKNRKPEFEDILLSRVGAGIGEAAVIDSDLEFAIYVSTGLLKPHKSQIHARYLELWLNSPIGRGFSERNTLGKGVSQGNLNLTLIRSFVVSLPPLKEQLRIVAKFTELNEMCDQLIERLRDSQQTQLQLTDAIVEQAL
ncbi:restriction endonuclease subunit S [Vibrio cholerae]|uniref:restriction endonuclease subunit S n=1 Tax=Vibrio cholerae TaxID=666 RepID=UPI00115962B3|nr:restriction endonuclease subunit S [Vibrio cholerae]MUH70636.1 restriction endonuclease subunit S [Vibrio cholerae]TQO82145.1 restriction endonuclease subunit S [Vibrio cholerae]TXY49241.1 restriction endonuclease subunit S [Vibrio cholerae]GHW45630.1 type I restriction endonuclease subunit S [Vibrio cholerae]